MKLRISLLLAGAPLAALGLAPSALATHLYVSNYNSASISPFSISVSGLGKLSPISCPGSDCHTGTAPGGVAMTPDGKFLFTVNSVSNTVSPFAVAANGSLTPVPCSSCTTGDAPYWLAISPNGKFLYASNYASGSVSPFRINANGALTHIACPGSSCLTGGTPEQPAIDPNGRLLFVAVSGSEKVAIFRIATNGALTRVSCPGTKCATGHSPYADAITPNGRFLYVINYHSDTVSAYSINQGGALTPVTCGTACHTGASPEDLAITPDGKELYVTDNADNSLSYYAIHANGSLGKLICIGSSCATGSEPTGVAIAMVNRNYPFLYVANYGDSTLSPFYLGPGGELGPTACSTCATGSEPYTAPIVASPDQAPTAAFSTKVESGGKTVSFNAAGSTAAPGDQLESFSWRFGDGSKGSTEEPTTLVTHSYKKPGTYTVTLTVTDLAGCSNVPIFTGQSVYCNGAARARISRRIRVKAAAPAVSAKTMKATAKSTSAILNGLVATRGARVQWRFQYGQSTAYGNLTPLMTISRGRSHPVAVSFKLTGLARRTGYHFRLLVIIPRTSTRLAGRRVGHDMEFRTTS
jgi:6-phosphogluconolactonase